MATVEKSPEDLLNSLACALAIKLPLLRRPAGKLKHIPRDEDYQEIARRQAATGQTGSEECEHLLFSFQTTEANRVVRPVHAKAMPAMLTTPTDFDAWQSADVAEVPKLRQPSAAKRLKIVAKGERKDG